jgi:hypothetical protein
MTDEEQRWHVRIAPGEVKVLTLEQVDDLFRLDMIDEDTLLRQDGTEQWLPLRVVAGLDEDEAPAPSAAPAPPPPPPPVRSAPPPPPPPIPPPSPSERAPFAPSPSFIPPAPVSRAPTPPPPSLAPAVATSLPSAPSPSVAPPALATFPVAVAAPIAAQRPSRAEPALIGLAVLLGLLVTLYRNGALATLFASAGQSAAYGSLESSLGGPGFGTPRAVDALVAKSQAPKR